MTGYLAVFAPLATVFVAAAALMAPYAETLRAAGGVALLWLAVRGLGLLDPSGRKAVKCSGPGPVLTRHRKAHPARLGAAYAVYCATCCGPYLAAAGLLAAGAGSVRPALAAAALHAGLAALPVVAPVLVPRPRQWLFHLGRQEPSLARGGSLALGAIGLWLLLARPVRALVALAPAWFGQVIPRK